MIFQDDLDGVGPEHLTGFFVGWPDPPSPETHLRLLAGSGLVALARTAPDGPVVGFAAALTDGVLCAYLSLLEVLPEFQGQGVGRALVERVLARTDGLYMVDLTCDPNVQPFYARLGLRPTTGMALRRYEHQSGASSNATRA